MTFQEMEARFAQLHQQYMQRQISPQAFAQAVQQLRLTGPDGVWWQMDQNGAWLRWDGRGWVPTMPPYPADPPQPAASSPPSAPASSPMPARPIPPAAPRPPAPAMAVPAAPRPPKAPPKAPESLLDLLKLILRNMFKNFIVKAIFAVITMLFVWALHTYLLVGPNGGFAGGTNRFLDAVLALQGQVARGMLFWGLLFGLLSMIGARVWQLGPAKAAQSLIGTPRWLIDSFRSARLASLPLACGGAALTLIMGTILNNRLTSLILVGYGLVELTAQANSMPGLISRLGWSDAQRLLGGGKRPYNPAWTAPLVVGMLFGFMVAVIMPWVPWCGVGGAFVLLAMLGLSVGLMILRPKAGAVTLMLLLVLFVAVTPVLADDGGWEEAGGTLEGWIKSQGALQAVLQGLPPAVAAGIIGWLSATFGQSLGSLANIKIEDLTAILVKALNLANLNKGLEGIDADLRKQGVYVRNFLQGDPVLLFQGWYNIAGMTWDETLGRFTGANGLTCEGYVNKTFEPVKKLVEANFPGAKVQSVLFTEKSSTAPGFWNGVDALNEENHNLIKVTLPDGSEWAVDFHQHNSTVLSSSAPPIMRPWSEAQKIWRDYLGAKEFTETVVK